MAPELERDRSRHNSRKCEANNKEETNPNSRENNGKTTGAEERKIYPPRKKIIPTMIAIYLVFFLVALVR
jgi:hypothetical protein